MNTSESLSSTALLRDYTQFRVRFEPEDGVLRVSMQGQPVPCYSEAMLAEAQEIQGAIESGGGLVQHEGVRRRIEYVVLDSRVPGVFNLGGDISLFHRLIEARDRDGLTRYASRCVDVVSRIVNHYQLPCISISLVAGKALGGGMEAAVAGNVLIAERSAEFGLPEVLFNLFPGMGAYNLIARRAGPRVAEELITSGRTYSGEELHRMGLVDVLADDGQGEKALQDYVRANRRKRKTLHALSAVRETIAPVTKQDLEKIVPIWVDAALALDSRDLKVMEWLVSAQSRAFSTPAPASGAAAGDSVRVSLA